MTGGRSLVRSVSTCTIAVILLVVFLPVHGAARTLRVGPGADYPNLIAAADEALAGDTILVLNGTHSGGQNISGLVGSREAPIVIMAETAGSVVFEGGTSGWQLSDAAWLHIVGFEFTGQTGNGLNIDDAGTFDTPTHHIVIESCYFHDLDATGNNDLLKLSGLDSFEIRNCRFVNGSSGGSGADMVGCHNGLFLGNRFENMGSNCIQAKGGTQYIRIERNLFVNGGNRSVNLGGSTGLQFFRPQDAPFEAADLAVYSNVFIGSEAPIAYVGSVRVDVTNNTIWKPGKWVARILQETVDPDRFAPCGDNTFRNNIVVIDRNVSTEVNIGPNTNPDSFHFGHNLWYDLDDPEWEGPSLPVTELNGIVGVAPELADPANEDMTIGPGSPATGMGGDVTEPQRDFLGRLFNTPRSIGAVEGDSPSTGADQVRRATSGRDALQLRIAPNPAAAGTCRLSYRLDRPETVMIELYDEVGRFIRRMAERRDEAAAHSIELDLSDTSGSVLVIVKVGDHIYSTRVLATGTDAGGDR